jgi:hypothetical protein
MPHRDALSLEIERELEALDRALGGDVGDPELGAVVTEVRAQRPVPRGEFVAELDARVAGGFATETVRAKGNGGRALAAVPARLRPPRRVLFPVLSGAAALLVALVVAGSLLVSGDRGGGVTNEPLTATESGSPPSPQSAGGPRGATAAPATVAPGQGTRRVERTASLALVAPAGEIDRVADGVVRVTDEQRGIVLSSSVSSGSAGSTGASFELRVPSERLGPALAALSELADVRSRNQSSQDITASFTSPRERLIDALAERRALLRQLATASTPNATRSIRARLRMASRQIAAARAELRRLRARTSFSRIGVSVSPRSGAAGGAWGLDDALHDALRVLAVSLGVAVVALAVALPLAAGLVVLATGARVVRRRRREAALDAL